MKASPAVLPLDLPSGLLGLLILFCWHRGSKLQGSGSEEYCIQTLSLFFFFLSESRCLEWAGFVILEGFMGHHKARVVNIFE